jgi:hypothetical protein
MPTILLSDDFERIHDKRVVRPSRNAEGRRDDFDSSSFEP